MDAETLILQKAVPDFGMAGRLPGTAPAGPDDWIIADDAFGGQMALRDWLIANRTDMVLRLDPSAGPAAAELLKLILAIVAGRPGYKVRDGSVLRPDGVTVPLDGDDPLRAAARLVQEDLCILLPGPGDEHWLKGAALCFPASWSLEDKFDRPLRFIHDPVVAYDDPVARRVQRLFDGIRPGRPLIRQNLLAYEFGHLHQPRRVADRRRTPKTWGFLRSERQCLVRLPMTGAVVFTIHTYVMRRAEAPAALQAAAHAGVIPDAER